MSQMDNPADLYYEAEKLGTLALEETSAARSVNELEAIRVRYLGRKSRLSELLSSIGLLPVELRKEAGERFNAIKKTIEAALEASREALGDKARTVVEGGADLSLPGVRPALGSRHPLYVVMDEMVEIFYGLGYTVALGPEVETEFYNFDALNFPPDHPSRDLQDTLYLPGGYLLRTHTSPVQVRTMQAEPPSLRIIAPGRVYRADAVDPTHYPIFHQIEGLWVDEGVSMADLKGVLYEFFKRFYGKDVKVRFRPHFFPFTEPSAEMDMGCLNCEGAGCSACKGAGFIEMLGCGMVHPNVLRNVGYDAGKYTGLAFGIGVDRITMQRYGLGDIRLLWENDLRLLEQV